MYESIDPSRPGVVHEYDHIRMHDYENVSAAERAHSNWKHGGIVIIASVLCKIQENVFNYKTQKPMLVELNLPTFKNIV